MIRPRSLSFLVLLAAIVALGGLAIDMFLPALPTIGVEFAATPDRMQLTISVYLLGSAGGQLVIGPLSDCFGRRPVLIAGFLLFALASLALQLRILSISESMGGHDSEVMEWQAHRSRRRLSFGRRRCGM